MRESQPPYTNCLSFSWIVSSLVRALLLKGKAQKDAVRALANERPVGSGTSIANQSGNWQRWCLINIACHTIPRVFRYKGRNTWRQMGRRLMCIWLTMYKYCQLIKILFCSVLFYIKQWDRYCIFYTNKQSIIIAVTNYIQHRLVISFFNALFW